MCTGSYVQPWSNCLDVYCWCNIVDVYTHTPFRYGRVGLTTLIRFRMPPFLIQRKRDTNIRVHTSVFESFSTVHTIAMRKRYVFILHAWETDYRVHDVSVFESLRFRRFRPSTLIRKASVFESLHLGRRFRKPPFSWDKVSVFHRIRVDDRRKRMQKYAFSNENGLVWTGP